MLSIEEIKLYLKENLIEKRHTHTLGVADIAKKLAKLNGISEEKKLKLQVLHMMWLKIYLKLECKK